MLQRTAFLILALFSAPAMSEILNHYSDYGVVEQSQLETNSDVDIQNDPFGYSDEYTDNESGLQYLQARYYNPVIMRFTQMDTYPLLNRYAYANENPIMNVDPSGHNPVGISNSQFSSGGATAKGISAGIGAISGLIIGILSATAMPEATPGVLAVVRIVAGLAQGALISASQTSISDAISHKTLSASSILESAGIGAGMAAISEGIFEGAGYGMKKFGGSIFDENVGDTIQNGNKSYPNKLQYLISSNNRIIPLTITSNDVTEISLISEPQSIPGIGEIYHTRFKLTLMNNTVKFVEGGNLNGELRTLLNTIEQDSNSINYGNIAESDEEKQSFINIVAKMQESGLGKYNLIFNNCNTFAKSVLDQMGNENYDINFFGRIRSRG